MNEISIMLLPKVNTFVIKKDSDSRVFITTPDSFIVRYDVFLNILLSMLKQGLIDEQVLSGLLEDYSTI